jgi:amino acid permease
MKKVIQYIWVCIAILLLAYAFITLVNGATERTVDSPFRFFFGHFTYAYAAMVLSAAILTSIWYFTRE